jgi:hypothetical protein
MGERARLRSSHLGDVRYVISITDPFVVNIYQIDKELTEKVDSILAEVNKVQRPFNKADIEKYLSDFQNRIKESYSTIIGEITNKIECLARENERLGGEKEGAIQDKEDLEKDLERVTKEKDALEKRQDDVKAKGDEAEKLMEVPQKLAAAQLVSDENNAIIVATMVEAQKALTDGKLADLHLWKERQQAMESFAKQDKLSIKFSSEKRSI